MSSNECQKYFKSLLLQNRESNRIGFSEIVKASEQKIKELIVKYNVTLKYQMIEIPNQGQKSNTESPEIAKNDEDIKVKQQEAKDFVKKLMAERNDRIQRELVRQSRFREKADKMMVDLNEKDEMRKEMEQKKRIDDSLERFKQSRKKRQEEMKQMLEQSKGKAMPSRDYIYKRIEAKYKEENEKASLQMRKEELERKRSKLKPISKEVIKEHMQNYSQIMNQRREVQVQKYQNQKIEEALRAEIQKQYLTSFSQKTYIKDQAAKWREKNVKQYKKALRTKMIQYSELVKELRPLKESKAKAMELKSIISRLKHPVREQRDVKANYEISKVIQMDTGRRLRPKKAEQYNSLGSKIGSRKSLVDRSRRSFEPAIIPAKSAQKSYLGYNKTGASSVVKAKKYNWEEDIKNQRLNMNDKYSIVLGKVGLMEQQAKMKEKIMNAQSNSNTNFELGESVSDIFVNAIRAKLALLDNM